MTQFWTRKRLHPDSVQDSIWIRIVAADLINDSIWTKISNLQVPTNIIRQTVQWSAVLLIIPDVANSNPNPCCCSAHFLICQWWTCSSDCIHDKIMAWHHNHDGMSTALICSCLRLIGYRRHDGRANSFSCVRYRSRIRLNRRVVPTIASCIQCMAAVAWPPYPPLGLIWTVMLVWRKGNINRTVSVL